MANIIGLRGTARKIKTTTSITLNCAAGGDFKTAPQLSDNMMTIIYYTDDSLLPQFNAPAGWSQIQNSTFVNGVVVFQIWRRIANASESSYTWTAVNNGQSAQAFILHAVSLTNAWQTAFNPGGADPLPFRKFNQPGALSQPTATANMSTAGSALMAGFSYDSNAQIYTGLNTINGNIPQVAFADNISVVSSGMSVITGLWLTPGIGVWTPTATANGTFGSYGNTRWGIKVQPLPTINPPFPAIYQDIFTSISRRRRRQRIHS